MDRHFTTDYTQHTEIQKHTPTNSFKTKLLIIDKVQIFI